MTLRALFSRRHLAARMAEVEGFVGTLAINTTATGENVILVTPGNPAQVIGQFERIGVVPLHID